MSLGVGKLLHRWLDAMNPGPVASGGTGVGASAPAAKAAAPEEVVDVSEIARPAIEAPDAAARKKLVRELLDELMDRLPGIAKLSAKKHVDAIVEDIDRIAAQRIEVRGEEFGKMAPEAQRATVASAVDEVMAKYAAMMTPKQFAIAFGLLAGMIGIGGAWLPLQQPLGALLGPLLGAAWWKWGLVAGSWGKLVSNPPQDVLFRDLDRGGTKPESRFLELMKALPPSQASQIGDNASAGVSLLTYTQMNLNGLFGLLAQTPASAVPDSLAHVINMYLKAYWYVPVDGDHLAVLRNVVRDRIDKAGYDEAAAMLRKSVTLEAAGDKQDAAPRLKAAMALLDALVEPARFAEKRAPRVKERAPLPTVEELPVALSRRTREGQAASRSRRLLTTAN